MASSKTKQNGNNNGTNSHSINNNNTPNSKKQQKIKKPKTRDSDCCSINFIKYVLLIFNIIYFMSGVAVVSVAVWTIAFKHQYISLLSTSNYLFCSYGLLLAGSLGVFVGIIGCCGVWRENRAIILFYTILLIAVFVLEFASGGLAYIYESQISNELNRTLTDTFNNNYGFNEPQTNAIDALQKNFQCCGAIRFEDYQNSQWIRSKRTDLIRHPENRKIPDSCCITVTNGCGKRDHPSNIFYTGCIYRLKDEIKEHLNIIGSVGLGICFIKIFGVILSCALYVKLKKLYEQRMDAPPPLSLLAADQGSFAYTEEDDDDILPEPPSSHFSNNHNGAINRPNSISYDRNRV